MKALLYNNYCVSKHTLRGCGIESLPQSLDVIHTGGGGFTEGPSDSAVKGVTICIFPECPDRC